MVWTYLEVKVWFSLKGIWPPRSKAQKYMTSGGSSSKVIRRFKLKSLDSQLGANNYTPLPTHRALTGGE